MLINKCGNLMAFAGMLTSAMLFFATSAAAENIQEVCEAALGAEGVDDLSGCSCMQDYVEGNPDLEQELISLADSGPGIEPRREAASTEGKAALDACFG